MGRMHLTGDALVLEMDAPVIGGISEAHLFALVQIWDRLIQDLVPFCAKPLPALRRSRPPRICRPGRTWRALRLYECRVPNAFWRENQKDQPVSALSPKKMPSRRSLLLASVSFLSLLTAHAAHAGDILRSGAGMPPPIAAAAAATAASQQAAAAAARAQDSLTRTTQALQAIQAAQSAARAAALALPSMVPNGLAPGGLQVVDNPVPAAQDTAGLNTWDGADAPTQTTQTDGHVDVTVKQTASRAILSWKSFNVGKDTTLTYDQQGNADWVALNRVVGAGAAPSQILGQIKSDGTVLIINQNGILFGGTSQINTNSLIASTLDVGSPANIVTGAASTAADRNQQFLTYGLLGYRDSLNDPLAIGGAVPHSPAMARTPTPTSRIRAPERSKSTPAPNSRAETAAISF